MRSIKQSLLDIIHRMKKHTPHEEAIIFPECLTYAIIMANMHIIFELKRNAKNN